MANARATNISSSDIDSESRKKLKGDLIGDTVYSETFILKTLLKLDNVEWCKDFEDDLCFLWDATIEGDVCNFLIAQDFLSLAVGSLIKETEPRLIEILIGILGNITVVDSTCIRPIDWEFVLSYLSSDDHLILIQIVRLIKTAAQNLTELKFLNTQVISKLLFILNNSLNRVLLEVTLDAFVKMTTEQKLPVNLLKREIYPSILEGYKNCKSTRTAATYILQLLANTASYANDGLLNSNILDEWNNGFLKVLSDLLESYFDAEDEDLNCDELRFLIESLDYICPILLLHDLKVTQGLLNLFKRISDGDVHVDFHTVLINVLCFSLANLNSNEFSQFKDYLHVLERLKILQVDCEYDYLDNLNSIIKCK